MLEVLAPRTQVPKSSQEVNALVDAFRGSDEWKKIVEILQRARNDHLEICTDYSSTLEAIRFAQGAIAAIDAFLEIPMQLYTEAM